jgi:hypothetical protein
VTLDAARVVVSRSRCWSSRSGPSAKARSSGGRASLVASRPSKLSSQRTQASPGKRFRRPAPSASPVGAKRSRRRRDGACPPRPHGSCRPPLRRTTRTGVVGASGLQRQGATAGRAGLFAASSGLRRTAQPLDRSDSARRVDQPVRAGAAG